MIQRGPDLQLSAQSFTPQERCKEGGEAEEGQHDRHDCPAVVIRNDDQQERRGDQQEEHRADGGPRPQSDGSPRAHARRDPAVGERLRLSLDAVRHAMEHLESNGFARLAFLPGRSETDSVGRIRITLVHPRLYEAAFYTPSQFAWLGLPSLRVSQHLMMSAPFHDPTQILRFTSEVNSAFSSLWSNYPMRPQRRQGNASALRG